MAATFMFAATIAIELMNPNSKARSLIKLLASSEKSLDEILPVLLSFIPDICDDAHLYLAVEAVRRFYNPTTRSFEQKLLDKMSEIAPVLFPRMVAALHRPTASGGGSRRSDAALIAALKTLLHDKSGLKHFSECRGLTDHIDVLIQRWISNTSSKDPQAATDLGSIIETLSNFLPTRKYVEGKTKRRFRFPVAPPHIRFPKLPTSSTTSPSARPRRSSHHGPLDALGNVLHRVVKTPAPTPKRRAYDYVLAFLKRVMKAFSRLAPPRRRLRS